jgi:hypothetical protein
MAASRLWLWQAPNRVKAACAMARIGGDGGERPVRVIHAAPPFQDDDKAQMVLEGRAGMITVDFCRGSGGRVPGHQQPGGGGPGQWRRHRAGHPGLSD